MNTEQPSPKSALPTGPFGLRLLRLCGLLLANPGLSADDLVTLVDSSRRTVFRHIRLLRSAGFIVRFDNERGGYVIKCGPRLLVHDLPAAVADEETHRDSKLDALHAEAES